jgi:hypothetical protein
MDSWWEELDEEMLALLRANGPMDPADLARKRDVGRCRVLLPGPALGAWPHPHSVRRNSPESDRRSGVIQNLQRREGYGRPGPRRGGAGAAGKRFRIRTATRGLPCTDREAARMKSGGRAAGGGELHRAQRLPPHLRDGSSFNARALPSRGREVSDGRPECAADSLPDGLL